MYHEQPPGWAYSVPPTRFQTILHHTVIPPHATPRKSTHLIMSQPSLTCVSFLLKVKTHQLAGKTSISLKTLHDPDTSFLSFVLSFYNFLCFLFLFFFFLGPHLWPLEGARLGVELELQLLAYITATATQDTSCACDPHHSSWLCWIPNPLRGARDRTCVLMDASWVRDHCATMGTPSFVLSFDALSLHHTQCS